MIQVGDVDPIGLRVVEDLLQEGVCKSARYHATTASTNTLALDDLRAGPILADQLPRLYLADDQTSGRGRHGRTWSSTRGTLTFSLLIDWDLESSRVSRLLSLAVGVGLARAIEYTFAPLRTRLKWPNDLYIDGGKAAGVLIETSQSGQSGRPRVVIGVGVNVNESPVLDQPDAPPVRSIAEVSGRRVGRYEILESVVRETLGATDQIATGEGEIVGEFRARCVLTGQRVTYRRGNKEYEGECVGVANEGELVIETEEGRRHLQSGEARLVRIRH